MQIDPKKVPVPDFHKLLLGTVAPRPIAFASTIDKQGNVNLSPFSFFNCFGANPPILIFSPARRVRDNTIKHTLENVYEVDEVVINIVNYELVHQASLASTEYEKGVNEFIKSGLTQAPSVMVKPPRVAEAPVSFECKVLQIMPLGKEKGAGNLVICEVLLAHCKDELLDASGKIDPHKIDLVARMGEDYYCRASGGAIFEVEKPLQKKGIGVDAIPFEIRNSKVLTGNDLGRLGNIEKLPERSASEEFKNNPAVKMIFSTYNKDKKNEASIHELHTLAKAMLEEGRVEEAWSVLLIELK